MTNKDLVILILAAGRGTRLKSSFAKVLHAAGVLETDALALRTKSLAVWRQTLSAKVAGSRNLWDETSADRVGALAAGRDWPFVMLSSIASLSPPLAAGQSDYAAANRYQRALAQELAAAPDFAAGAARTTRTPNAPNQYRAIVSRCTPIAHSPPLRRQRAGFCCSAARMNSVEPRC